MKNIIKIYRIFLITTRFFSSFFLYNDDIFDFKSYIYIRRKSLCLLKLMFKCLLFS